MTGTYIYYCTRPFASSPTILPRRKTRNRFCIRGFFFNEKTPIFALRAHMPLGWFGNAPKTACETSHIRARTSRRLFNLDFFQTYICIFIQRVCQRKNSDSRLIILLMVLFAMLHNPVRVCVYICIYIHITRRYIYVSI